ncbi:30S ribosomal protein S17 [Candidatus Anaplasma sp. TIGMIC]|uniref:30S ribosomal protein S17 n=1 Tax=Candidatus Anaplasma sp. TIGMIC TaxID=3020713 RepID=UPI002330F4CE|nr:30S ribosomal protein S17 [Candidatus Anaplasma sp. TIGMIC]MDB1135251.1 30S ribosomal protein S17 [Candidatus Anaplasma sp. TIGMIC]
MSKRVLVGVVTDTRRDKTVKVSVYRMVHHKVYKKIVKECRVYSLHDEHNKCVRGDVVKIREHIPVSATKRWIIVDE